MNIQLSKLRDISIRIFLGSCGVVAAPSAWATDYCPSRSSYASYEWIKEVQVNGVASPSGASTYTLFTNPTYQLKTGQNPITLTPGFRSSTYTEKWSVFVDLNQDGQFTTEEQLFTGSSSAALSGSLVIPSTAKNGPTRMRVSMRYGASPAACASFIYGEVEDYTVNVQNTAAPPPPAATTVVTSTLSGFDRAYPGDLVVIARFQKKGVLYSSTNLFWNGGALSRAISLEVDIGSQIEWRAQVYLDDSPNGVFVPASCEIVDGTKCITGAGSIGESVMFKSQAPPPPPPPPPPVDPPPPVATPDQVLNFNSLFSSGLTYQAGPSLNLGSGITATTTGSYFYNPSGAPFASGYLSFINLGLAFPAPVVQLSFEAAGSCSNCLQTVQVVADGQVVQSFTLSYNVVSNIVITLPTAATSIYFDKNFKMDNLGIDYQ